jgi:Transmembrane protein family 232
VQPSSRAVCIVSRGMLLDVADSLQLLIESLDRAALDDSYIAVLFYLAEFVLYVIRTESVCEEYLSSVELQLLMVGRLVFTRLYFHHMAGHLGRFSDLKSQLHKYIDGTYNVVGYTLIVWSMSRTSPLHPCSACVVFV